MKEQYQEYIQTSKSPFQVKKILNEHVFDHFTSGRMFKKEPYLYGKITEDYYLIEIPHNLSLAKSRTYVKVEVKSSLEGSVIVIEKESKKYPKWLFVSLCLLWFFWAILNPILLVVPTVFLVVNLYKKNLDKQAVKITIEKIYKVLELYAK